MVGENLLALKNGGNHFLQMDYLLNTCFNLAFTTRQ